MKAFFALLLLLLSACSGILPESGGGRAVRPLPVDSQVVRGVLSNGLRYYVRANREPRARAELRLVVKVGSILEDEDQRGLAHFVEHMAFNGTERFEKQELVDYLEGVGMRFGPDINAYTSFDETVYTLTVPTDSAGVLETGVQILEEWAHRVSFDSVEVEKERGVVTEEWRLGQGASARMQEREFPVLVGTSRYAERLPIGTLESLRTFRHSALRRFYRDWYRPDQMAVVAVGDFDPLRIEAVIREHFEPLRNPPRARPRTRYDVPAHRATVVSVATDAEATASSISLYMKRKPTVWSTVGAYRRSLVEMLASEMLTNRISERTQRPGSPFLDISTYQGRFLYPVALYMLNVRVPDEGIGRGVEELLLEVERAHRHGFTTTELQRAKQVAMRRVEQRYRERAQNTSGTFAADYVSEFAYGGWTMAVEEEYRLQRELLPQISAREVHAIARDWIGAGNRVVLVNAPERAASSIPSERALISLIRRVRGRAVEPYADSVSTAPLLASPPEPGALTAEREIPEVGVTEWTLSNGVRVILKPTDFRQDEILLAGRSPGGTSLVSDEDYLAAVLAPALAQAGGLGDLSVIELTKRLAGAEVGVGADITETAELLSGAGSPQDVETLFQLVYLKFTSPRVDSSAVEAYRTQAQATLANRSASPEQVFSDSLRATLTQGHPRARPLSSSDFERLDVERSLAIYRDRFADASDFTFFLVGSFDLETVRPLVLRYLGGLPSLGRTERSRDVGIRPPRGVVRRTVRKGIEAKAATQIVFTGEAEFSRETIYALNAMAQVLQLRLREVLREDRGGTYGASVRAGAAREPRPRYQVSIGFGSDPARVDELTEATFAEIQRLRRDGPSRGDIEKVREMEARSRETELRSNQFWMAQLMSYDQQSWPMVGILRYPEWLAGLDPELVRAPANRYLDLENYVQATLLPEAVGAQRRDSGR
ncbi:MAG: insulinase family protein [Gemmatimonadetes bacterium]|nr:insulinase family protein [Gemmatimonadota bacterium]